MQDRVFAALAVAAAALAAAFVAPSARAVPLPRMRLTSPSFKERGLIPKKHTCDGADVSPELRWTGLPKGTASLALIMEDPDAPAGTWVHWVLYDIPASAEGLSEGKPVGVAGKSWGVEAFAKVGYVGPCPPPGKPHRYVFTLYALGAAPGLPPLATKADLLAAIENSTLGTAELVGLYGR